MDMVCLAMILDLKPLVFDNDQSIMLCRFMKFPDEKNIRKIIKDSINLSSKFNGDIKIWNNNDIRKTVNYLKHSINLEKIHLLELNNTTESIEMYYIN